MSEDLRIINGTVECYDTHTESFLSSLQPNSILEVQLNQHWETDGSIREVATCIKSGTESLTMDFSLTFDKRHIHPDYRCSLSATLKINGRTEYASAKVEFIDLAMAQLLVMSVFIRNV